MSTDWERRMSVRIQLIAISIVLVSILYGLVRGPTDPLNDVLIHLAK